MTAFLLGATLWAPLNHIGPWNREAQAARVVKKQGTALEQFLATAMDQSKPRHVLVSVKGGKVYVGRVVDAFEPADRDPNILLLPTLSGYRGKDDQMICWTLNYDEAYSDIAKETKPEVRAERMAEFGIVMPITEITSITSFSYDVYHKYFIEYSKGDIAV